MAGATVVGVLYVLARFLGQLAFQPGSKAWEKTVKSLRLQIAQVRKGLVPWSDDMLPLLSLNRQDTRAPGVFGGPYRGVFTSIYHEPVLAYAYHPSGANGILLLQSSNQEWVYRMYKGEVEIWSNGQPLGVFKDGVLLGAGKNAKMLARLEREGFDTQFPLTIFDQAAATINNPDHVHAPNPRVLVPLRELSGQTEIIALAVAGLEMVRTIPQRNK